MKSPEKLQQIFKVELASLQPAPQKADKPQKAEFSIESINFMLRKKCKKKALPITELRETILPTIIQKHKEFLAIKQDLGEQVD